ncbi:tetratricopeptide repeat protein [Streptomyces chrestomyceticus]|uniref:Tetratricopeptide repeat protein n=1 Tax=Streptomyces chrestomyceticus TaxID=68185 RepID=A0ABU7X6U3_9ACTN
MDRQRNTVLEALLLERDFSHTGLADEVNEVVADLFGQRGRCTDRHVRRWVSGEARWPWTTYLLALEHIFGRPPQALGFVPRGKCSASLPARPSRPSSASTQEAPVHRRHFLAASAAATVALALGIDDTPVRGRLSMSDMDRIDRSIGRLDAHFFALGGGPLLGVCTAYVERLRDTLDGCAYGERVEKRLHASNSSLYASAGWAAHDSGEPRQAGLLHTASLQSALLATDPSAVARAWSNLALQARLEGRHREAVQITRAALDVRRVRQDPRIAALLHARLAIGRARTADRTGAARSLLAAEQAYDRVDTAGPAPTWLGFLSEGELSGLAAITHQALGHYDQAQAATVQALHLLPPAMRRSRAYYGVQLAEIHLAQGEHEQAAHTIATLDATSLDSRRITGRLAAVQHTLTT